MRKIKLLLITISFVSTQGFAQVRQNIEDFSEELQTKEKQQKRF